MGIEVDLPLSEKVGNDRMQACYEGLSGGA